MSFLDSCMEWFDALRKDREFDPDRVRLEIPNVVDEECESKLEDLVLPSKHTIKMLKITDYVRTSESSLETCAERATKYLKLLVRAGPFRDVKSIQTLHLDRLCLSCNDSEDMNEFVAWIRSIHIQRFKMGDCTFTDLLNGGVPALQQLFGTNTLVNQDTTTSSLQEASRPFIGTLEFFRSLMALEHLRDQQIRLELHKSIQEIEFLYLPRLVTWLDVTEFIHNNPHLLKVTCRVLHGDDDDDNEDDNVDDDWDEEEDDDEGNKEGEGKDDNDASLGPHDPDTRLKLKSLDLEFENRGQLPTYLCQAFGHLLAQATELEHLTLEGQQPSNICPVQKYNFLRDAKSVRHLHLRNFPVVSSTLVDLIKPPNGNLKELKLNNNSHRILNLSELLSPPNDDHLSCLDYLEIEPFRGDKNGIMALQNLLQNNKGPKALSVYLYDHGTERAFAQSLRKNSKVEHLQVLLRNHHTITKTPDVIYDFIRLVGTMPRLRKWTLGIYPDPSLREGSFIDDCRKLFINQGLIESKTIQEMKFPLKFRDSSEPLLEKEVERIPQFRRLLRDESLADGIWARAFSSINDNPTLIFHLLLLKPWLIPSNNNNNQDAVPPPHKRQKSPGIFHTPNCPGCKLWGDVV